MISRESIQKILEFGVMAPSGDNCQPWRFVVHGDEIKIYNIPERDQSLYSYGQHASYFAHGALLENISIAAEAMGFKSAIEIFPDSGNPTLIAICKLTESSKSNNQSLYDAIPKRTTNRKPYKKTPLTEIQRKAILDVGETAVGANLVLVEDPLKQQEIGYAASVNEEMLFGVERMHHFFFNHINWTPKEDAQKSTGFYIKTLELPGAAKPLFKILKNWEVAKILTKIGLPKQIAKGNAKNIYITGAAHGVVAINGNQSNDFISAGQLMERIWLTVTSLGLSLQPLAGITFLMQGISAEDTSPLFTAEQLKTIKSAYNTMQVAYGLPNQTLVMAFRIGEGDIPSAHATRLPPDVRFE